MEFVSKIKYLQAKLISDQYIKCILAKLRKEDVPEIDFHEKRKFDLSLPLDFSHFLAECNIILKQCTIEKLDFREINVEYLITLIYTGLYYEDTMLESESVPIQALTLFLQLQSERYIDVLKIDEIVFDSMLEKVIETNIKMVSNKKVSGDLMLTWNKFIATNKNFDVEKVLNIFVITLVANTTSIVYSLDIDNEKPIEISKSIFICLKTLIEEQCCDNKKQNIVARIALKLVEICNDDVLTQNVLYFFKNVLHKCCDEKWYFSLLMIIPTRIKNKEIFVRIINQLPIEKHESMVNIIINNYVQAINEDEIEIYLTIINLVIMIPYQDNPDDRRQKLVKRILTETYFCSLHKNHTIKEHIMELFIKWCQMKDLNVRRHMQLMFHNGNKVQAAQLFEILLQSVDISWKIPSYNATFIIFTCRMFILNRSFISQYRMRILEILCYKATAHCLRPCVPAIIELIRYFALAPHPILKPMLTLILNNALSATSAANYYMKEIFGLFSNCMVATSDSEVEFFICNTILSDDFNCAELFKMMQIHNFIRAEHIEVLLKEKILKYPCSWKLLTLLLDNIEYTNLPQYIEHYFEKIKSPAFFMRSESIHMLQVMTKIFITKIKHNLVTNADFKLVNMIDENLTNHVKALTVPAKQIGEAIILLLTINKITQTSLNWFGTFFAEILALILDKAHQLTSVSFARNIVYLEQMFILLDINMDDDSVNKLMAVMGIEQQLSIPQNQIYASLVSFFGKVCLKYNNWVTDAIPLIQHAMINGPPPVQVMAISTLYDISNLHLNYYDPLHPGLLTLIKSENIEVKNLAVKVLIKLVNDSHIRLTCNDFITLMLVLVDRNYKLCLYFVDIFESDFIHRNQHTISKYFINLLFYLNKYKDHQHYFVTLDDAMGNQDLTYERRIIIYKFLFCNLERQNQLQILNVLNAEFLISFYHGRINPTSNMFNILRDILTLVCFNASQYVNRIKFNNIDEFYKVLFEDMKRDFFTRKRFSESGYMEFDKALENLFLSLLRILYKVEKSNISMLPQILSTIGLATRAFYNKIVHMVHDNSKLKNLYYELENCYMKYKEMIRSEPLDILGYCDKQEWRLYLGSPLQIT